MHEENKIFLKSPYSLQVFPSIPNDYPNWFDHVRKQGQLFKAQLNSSYPLAFTENPCDELSYEAVVPNEITIDPGIQPINRTTAIRCPYGHEVACSQFLEKLLRQHIIKHWDHPIIWWAQARFILKSDGSLRLVINFRGLNAASSRIGYPFSS